MFSGLTNQVTSWIGQAKGEPQDEEVPAPPAGMEQTEQVEPQPMSPQAQHSSELTEELNVEGAEDGDKKQRFVYFSYIVNSNIKSLFSLKI